MDGEKTITINSSSCCCDVDVEAISKSSLPRKTTRDDVNGILNVKNAFLNTATLKRHLTQSTTKRRGVKRD